MKRESSKKFRPVATTIVLLVIGIILWTNWLSYYWYTDSLHLYQSKDSFRLCGGSEELVPSWRPNEEYHLHISEAEQAVAEGKAVSIIARGLISGTGSEVYVDKIIDIIVGADAKCEEKH